MANAFSSVSRGVIFQELCIIGGDIIQLIPFICAFYAFKFLHFTIIVIVKVMSQSSHLPWGFVKMILVGGALFALAHFRVLHSTINHFPCLFPSIANDTHSISPPLIISSTYEHFQTKLHAIGLSIQLKICVAWSPSGLQPNFNTPSQFTAPSKGTRVLRVPLNTLTFTSSFIKNALLENAQPVDLFPRMGDV